MNLFFDSDLDDAQRRAALYAGDVFVYASIPAALALAERAAAMLEAAFAPHHPTRAQYALPVEAYAAILADVKPRFIHDPECKRLIPQLVDELGADRAQTHFDVPRLRSATAHSFLTTGIAYAFHAHRDTWYSAPQAQINWWFPVYAMEAGNGMAFHPEWFDRPVPNSSDTYNYYRWNRDSRASAAQQVAKDTRIQPRLTSEVRLDPDVRVVVPVGGVMLFSGQQLHSTVQNASDLTRFSIDFRTVNRSDLESFRGAPNVDVHCTGTTLRDFISCDDLTGLPERLIAGYDDDSASTYAESLTYAPPIA